MNSLTTTTGQTARRRCRSAPSLSLRTKWPRSSSAPNATISFSSSPGEGARRTATGTVNVPVTPVNDDPPTANPDSFTLAEDDPATVLNVMANDSDAPDSGETLSVSAVTPATHGVVTLI